MMTTESAQMLTFLLNLIPDSVFMPVSHFIEKTFFPQIHDMICTQCEVDYSTSSEDDYWVEAAA